MFTEDGGGNCRWTHEADCAFDQATLTDDNHQLYTTEHSMIYYLHTIRKSMQIQNVY